MDFIKAAISQPVTVAVGVILIIMAGVIAITRIPVQLTPNVEDTIVTVTTMWEGASPQEVEQELVDKQEEKLQGLSNLRQITSECQQGQGIIRLEFTTGTRKDDVLRAVGDKLREVPSYPENVDEPVVEASDRMNRDYIAWIIFGSTDPNLDIRTLQDFAEDRIKPALERVEGMSEVGVLGGYEREAQIRFDPMLLAQRGVTPAELVQAIELTNRDVSAGQVQDAKSDVRIRTVSQYDSIEDVERTVIKHTEAGPIYVGDVARVVEDYKEPFSFVRSKGHPVIAINAQREIGSNVMEVMDRLRAEIDRLNQPGGVLDSQARALGMNGKLTLEQVYDQTVYIEDALELVRENIWVGGFLATLALLVFLRSIRTVAIVIIATPISVVGAIVAMVMMGRTINVISLAGMAFAVGMVVDNAIVIVENIFRHLEMGKKPMQASYDGTREVWGAVLAATGTNVIVFIPVLLIQEEAGQLFRDIALAICATALLSLLISITVVPAMAARLMKQVKQAKPGSSKAADATRAKSTKPVAAILRAPKLALGWLDRFPDALSRTIYLLSGSVMARLAVVIALTAASVIGSYLLMPPADYLPTGNRNLVFGMMFPPPGYNLEQQRVLAERVEQTIRPFWEAAEFDADSEEYRQAAANLPAVPTFDFATMSPGPNVVPPPLDNYFFVAFESMMFHGAISDDEQRVVDLMPLFQHATRAEHAPGVLAFAMQVPLFQLGGSTGSAVKIDFSGRDLGKVSEAASAAYLQLIQRFGPHTVQPSPSNFNLPGPELQIVPNRRRLAEVGMSPVELGTAVQAGGDGYIAGEYRIGGETIDLKIISEHAVGSKYIQGLEDSPIATTFGSVVPPGQSGRYSARDQPAADQPHQSAAGGVAGIHRARRDATRTSHHRN